MRPNHFVSWNYVYPFNRELDIRASSQVAHLTYNREKPEEKTSWSIGQYFMTLREPIFLFLSDASKSDSLMQYKNNRNRTEQLLKFLQKPHLGKTIQVVVS